MIMITRQVPLFLTKVSNILPKKFLYFHTKESNVIPKLYKESGKGCAAKKGGEEKGNFKKW